MKKKLTFATLLILAVGILLAAIRQEEEPNMKLVNVNSGLVVVEFDVEGHPRFGDRFLEAEMTEAGIQIPPNKVVEFDGKKTIYIGDPLFQKAFVEIYVPLTIASSTYQWQ